MLNKYFLTLIFGSFISINASAGAIGVLGENFIKYVFGMEGKIAAQTVVKQAIKVYTNECDSPSKDSDANCKKLEGLYKRCVEKEINNIKNIDLTIDFCNSADLKIYEESFLSKSFRYSLIAIILFSIILFSAIILSIIYTSIKEYFQEK
jgi:hypothetical protein